MRNTRRAFSLIELLVVVGIILFITGLSVPHFVSLFKSQGIAKAARMVQTAVMQARGRAVSVGRQQMILFKNDYDAPGRSIILVIDCQEDLDGDGSPWLVSTNGPNLVWETTDGETIAKVPLPGGFVWTKGTVGGTALPNMPVIVCMPDGTLKVVEEKSGPPFMTPCLVATTDNFNTAVQNNHELAVQRGVNGDRYFLHFMKSSGRVKIKAEP